jgi:F-type H+-transporting ATPase subunit b
LIGLNLGWSFILNIFNFLILWLVLRRLFWKPVNEFLLKREESIAQTLENAQKDRAQASEMMEQYQHQLAGIKKEARELIERATRQGEENRKELLLKAQQEAVQMKMRAQQEIEQERNKAQAELRKEVAELTILATGRLLEKELDELTNRRLVEQFLVDLEKVK